MHDTIQSHDAESRQLDTAFELLSHQRRRHTVAVLADRSSALPLQELAAAVAEREADDAEERGAHAVATDLHHTHLSKLHAAGVVDYDQSERVVDPLEVEALASAASPDVK